jgi:hypothetical protein
VEKEGVVGRGIVVLLHLECDRCRARRKGPCRTMSSTTWDGARTTFANDGMSFYHPRHSSGSRAARVVGALAWSNVPRSFGQGRFRGCRRLGFEDGRCIPAGRTAATDNVTLMLEREKRQTMCRAPTIERYFSSVRAGSSSTMAVAPARCANPMRSRSNSSVLNATVTRVKENDWLQRIARVSMRCARPLGSGRRT